MQTATKTTPTPAARLGSADVRDRWRMGVEARALVIVTAGLLAFGLATLYSASAIVALQEERGSAFYLLRQLGGVALGVVAFAAAAKIDAERWHRWAWPIMVASLLGMLVIVLPGTEFLAPRVNGSRRFLYGSSLQPSELAKFAVVVWTAMLVVKKGSQLRRLTKGVLPILVVIGVLDLLAILEPDLSVAMMFTLLMGTVLFVGGARVGHFVFLGALAVPVLWREIERLQYAVLRMASFLDPGSAPREVGYQLRQSLIAVGSGRLVGVGFGEGRQQYGFLPLGYNDFIGSNVGEEWGFIGIILLVLAYAAYALLGFRIARQARSQFLQLVAVGLTTTTVVTAYLHLGVVLGLLPTTGLTLPFVSYGRSNLVLSLAMTGILVNIGSARERVVGARATDPMAA
ncbi:MAG TPA: FtsW/RodA/SpoVE family cell cycle protein [Gemmatimonadaceae bacterium]|nr:FtsW/RodA/SpoVE family cell cycle protein [Gemmatimonadaceae bacterium]